MFSTFVLALSLSSLGFSLAAPSFQDVLSSHPNLTSFSSQLTSSYPDLITKIAGGTNITVLAPSNAAFDKTVYYPIIGPAFSNNDIGAIQAILDYHVVQGSYASADLLPTIQYFPTWLSNSSYSNVTNGQVVGAVNQLGKQVYWISGQSTRSLVVVKDIAFEGGTVHIVDSLLVPPSSFPDTAERFSTAAEPFEISSFLGATYYTPNDTTSSIATFLNDTSDLTIFAPNNAAMEVVQAALLALSNNAKNSDAFAELLKYHIVAKGGPYYSTGFSQKGQTLQSLAGGELTLSFSSNSFFVNGARILTSDLLVANGVVHVIDNVLSPDAASDKPNPSLATQAPALSTGGEFNASAAPFTTFLPNTIDTAQPVASATYSGDGYGAGGGATATGSGTAATSAGGSGSGSGAVKGVDDGVLMSLVIGFVVIGAVAVLI
jgi:transforming growth factor-beta-induced protein